MDNLLSYCGLVDAKISTFEKDLPVYIVNSATLLTLTSSLNHCRVKRVITWHFLALDFGPETMQSIWQILL